MLARASSTERGGKVKREGGCTHALGTAQVSPKAAWLVLPVTHRLSPQHPLLLKMAGAQAPSPHLAPGLRSRLPATPWLQGQGTEPGEADTELGWSRSLW